MPRPVRKPKRFVPTESRKERIETLVVSTPIHPKHSTAAFASPELSPIQRDDFIIHQDQDHNGPDSDEFGFARTKGIKRTVGKEEQDSNVDDDVSSDEDIYGTPLPKSAALTATPATNYPSSPPAPQPQPKIKKPIRQLRTSQLLQLMPTRRKRLVKRPSQKNSGLTTSDAESDNEVPVKPKISRKRRIVDKENAMPEESSAETDSEEDLAREERRKLIKEKFAEVDQWEMAFESVDLSFSSQ
jgi:hypothetical protein